MSGIDAVCFDLDGTLCVSAQDRDRLLSDAFADVGIDPAFDLADLWAVDTSSLPTAESSFEFHSNLFGAGARQTGATLSQGTIESLTDAYLARYDPAAVEPRDGALDALEAARLNGPVGLVTNGGEDVQTAKLRTLGIEDAFDVRVFCDLADGIEPKPDPRPLELALGELGTQAERSLMVGDSLGADVAGAHAVGMQSAWVPSTDPDGDPEPTPTHVLDSPGQLSTLW